MLKVIAKKIIKKVTIPVRFPLNIQKITFTFVALTNLLSDIVDDLINGELISPHLLDVHILMYIKS